VNLIAGGDGDARRELKSMDAPGSLALSAPAAGLGLVTLMHLLVEQLGFQRLANLFEMLATNISCPWVDCWSMQVLARLLCLRWKFA